MVVGVDFTPVADWVAPNWPLDGELQAKPSEDPPQYVQVRWLKPINEHHS